MARFFIDTEFIEDGHTIDLISIGIVAEDGRAYYAQSVEFDPRKACEWVWEHVFPHLRICPYITQGNILALQAHLPRAMLQHHRGKCIPTANEPDRHRCPWRTREHIADEVRWFINAYEGTPQFWAWYADYDWVVFCQLFGRMMDLPKGWPMYCRDLKQWCDMLGNPRMPEQSEGEHNALADARHNLVRYQFLEKLSKEQSYGTR